MLKLRIRIRIRIRIRTRLNNIYYSYNYVEDCSLKIWIIMIIIKVIHDLSYRVGSID